MKKKTSKKTLYMRAYRKKNRECMREYNKQWTRLKRMSPLPIRFAPLKINRTKNIVKQRPLLEDSKLLDVVYLEFARKRTRKSARPPKSARRCLSCESLLNERNSRKRDRYCYYCQDRFNLA